MTALLLLALLAGAPAPAPYELAVTFDDLPAVVAGTNALGPEREVTEKLVAAIASRKIPVTGFVNAKQLVEGERIDPRRLALLRRWRDAGLQLGNHTYSHRDLHAMSQAEFEDEVIRGESGLGEVLAERGKKLVWFRHPFLHTGRSPEARRAAEAFLAGRGYRIAPVTIDNADWIFARAYDAAIAAGDATLQARIRADYVDYMLRKTDYFRREARAFCGREIAQVLLVHANRLNAAAFGDLADALRRGGARFISLDEALKDEAYRSRDEYYGAGGISWLHRWALTAGKKRDFFAGEPAAPEYVLRAAGVEGE